MSLLLNDWIELAAIQGELEGAKKVIDWCGKDISHESLKVLLNEVIKKIDSIRKRNKPIPKQKTYENLA